MWGQRDKLRTAAQTKDNVLTQIRLAALGIKKDVTEQQRATGTKDKLAEYWVEILIKRANEEQKRRITGSTAAADLRLRGKHGPERTVIVLAIKKEIQNELLDWLVTQPPEQYNNLPADSRRSE